MTTARDVGELLVCGFAGTSLPPDFAADLEARRVGGAILFRRNIPDDVPAVAEICREIRDAKKGAPPLVSVDQEGGRVARLGSPVIRVPSARIMVGKGGEERLLLVRKVAARQSRELCALGFSMNFAPVLDVHTNPENPVIGDRSFGTSADEAARFALAFFAGMRESGLLACGKHFPGHGDTSTDSHLELPVVKHEHERLETIELAPFAEASRQGIDALMTAHVLYPALDPTNPATLSLACSTELVRTRLGFRGVLVSDDLEMKAVADHYGYGDASVLAIAAGCDMLLICSRADARAMAYEALVREAERSPAFAARADEALRRVLSMRTRSLPAPMSREELDHLFADREAKELAAVLAEG